MSSNITLAPSMTIAQIFALLREHAEPGRRVSVKMEWMNGKPQVYLVNQKINFDEIPAFLRRQAQ